MKKLWTIVFITIQVLACDCCDIAKKRDTQFRSMENAHKEALEARMAGDVKNTLKWEEIEKRAEKRAEELDRERLKCEEGKHRLGEISKTLDESDKRLNS